MLMDQQNSVVEKIVKVLDSKKGIDIRVLDIRGLSVLADYFVIVTGSSDRQVQALADNVEEELDKEGVYPINKEGYNTAEWVLLGYDDVIVHIFQRETREFYGLEHVWQDAPEVDITGLLV